MITINTVVVMIIPVKPDHDIRDFHCELKKLHKIYIISYVHTMVGPEQRDWLYLAEYSCRFGSLRLDGGCYNY